MGLKLTITGEGGTPVTLVDDDSGDLARSGLSCNEQRSIDVQGLLRAEFVKIFDRLNKVKRVTFNTQKVHESAIEAHRFTLDHCDEVPSMGLIELEISDGEQTFTRWFEDAAVSSVGIPRVHGASTWQTYEIICSQTLIDNPSL